MGLVNSKIILKNPKDIDLESIEIDALVDTGSTYLSIPEHVQLQLKLEENSKKEVTLANGKKEMLSYVGPIEVIFKNRSCFVGAVVTGDEVLLGAIPMEDMDLIVIPKTRTVDINPINPNFAGAKLK